MIEKLVERLNLYSPMGGFSCDVEESLIIYNDQEFRFALTTIDEETGEVVLAEDEPEVDEESENELLDMLAMDIIKELGLMRE